MGKETDKKNRGSGTNYCFFGVLVTDNNGFEKEMSSRTPKGTSAEDIVIEEMLLISAVVFVERRPVHWKERENRCRTQRNHFARKTA